MDTKFIYRLYKRSNFLSKVRNFFFQKNIVEIETPALTKYTVTDLHLFPLQVIMDNKQDDLKSTLWLITSPEYHMKRLLSDGFGPMYQICHAFRDNEYGKLHNTEFTILEWYQPFYNMFDMIELIEIFLNNIFHILYSDKSSYEDIFMKFLNINPLSTDIQELNSILYNHGHKHLIHKENNISDLLSIIFNIFIEKKLGLYRPIFIYHYPFQQALLAKINQYDLRIADRFEIFFKGIEIGNGFCELIDADEQYRRFNHENNLRVYRNLKKRCIDQRFISSLRSIYMPDCSGVAIGLDRIVMILLNVCSIKEIISFDDKSC
ncbi:elongation factor P--(R)-beta-lysine ligase [Buchnera aphidicola]|uniref:elongation factor P--(R)-beta-lysine ligase n=1 Tax=Buchnera aphidicola TaxID=9 RepID=UPI0031B86BAF